MKFSIAATRPALCTAMNAIAEPLAFGSISATVSSGSRDVRDLSREQRDADAEARGVDLAG